MNFSNNPHAVYNGALSGQRNMFLTSSIAVAIIGFSNGLKTPLASTIVKILAIAIFLMSISIGVKSLFDFRYYLDEIGDSMPEHIPVDNWYRWTYVNIAYICILVFIVSLFLIDNNFFFKQ
jgi:hypothetical protein